MEKLKDFTRSKKQIFILFLYMLSFTIMISGKCLAMATEQDVKELKKNDNKRVCFYLVKGELKPFELSDMPISEIPLEDSPIFTSDDMLEYNITTHTFLLDSQANERISRLNIPVVGRAFVVTIDDESIYLGAFWSHASSISYKGIVIVSTDTYRNGRFKLQAGYPDRSFFIGHDFRNHPEILEILSNRSR